LDNTYFVNAYQNIVDKVTWMVNFKHKTQVGKPNVNIFVMGREFSKYHVLLEMEFAIETKFQMLFHFKEHIFDFPTFILNAMWKT